MAFVNLPPNLQDMFYALSDRIMKLETGPNQAMYTALAAQGGSTQASTEAAQALQQAQAANALGVQAIQEANIAIAQGTIAIQTANEANAEAIQATYEAGVAQTTANGKNKSTYSTSAASGTAQNGDLWFQVNGSGAVINQYSYNNGWQTMPITNTVISNLDAGKITAGTITGIAYNNGSGTFSVSPAGVLVASSATITGNITATSGTFTGTVYASSGTFTGTITSNNATITGGSLTVGSTFSVNSSGYMIASSGTIGGVTMSSTALTGGTIQTSSGGNSVVLSGSDNAIGIKSGGTYAGWIGSIGSGAVLMHYGTTPSSTAYPRVQVSSTTASLAAGGSNSLSITTSGSNHQGNITFGGTTNTFTNTIAANGTINYTGIATGSGSTMVIVTTGSRVAYTTSSERFKQDITYINTTGWLDKVLAMQPITYRTDVDYVVEGEPNDTQYGFLAEDIYEIGGGLEKSVILDPLGDPFSLSYDRLTVYLTLAIKELEARVKTLEGN